MATYLTYNHNTNQFMIETTEEIKTFLKKQAEDYVESYASLLRGYGNNMIEMYFDMFGYESYYLDEEDLYNYNINFDNDNGCFEIRNIRYGDEYKIYSNIIVDEDYKEYDSDYKDVLIQQIQDKLESIFEQDKSYKKVFHLKEYTKGQQVIDSI